MSFNGCAQISDASLKRFVGILPNVPFFSLNKAVTSLSILSIYFSAGEIKVLVY